MIDVKYCKIKGLIEDRALKLAELNFSGSNLTIQNLRHRSTYTVFSVIGLKNDIAAYDFSSIEIITIGSIEWKQEFMRTPHIYVKVNGDNLEDIRKIFSNMWESSVALLDDIMQINVASSYQDAVDAISSKLGVKNGVFFHAGKPYTIKFGSDEEDF